MSTVIDTLITDRTQADVDALIALLKAGTNPIDHKGSYNASDLNRVGEAIDYIKNRLYSVGIMKDSEWYSQAETDNTAGNPAVILSKHNCPLCSCVLNIVPSQAGSGTPSSSNIRTITGHSTATLAHTGKNLVNQKDFISSYLVWNGDVGTWTVGSGINYAMLRVAVKLLAGVTYTVSCYIKAITKDPNYAPRVVFRTTSWSIVKQASMSSSTTEGYLSCSYTPTKDTEMYVGVMGTGSPGGGCKLEISKFQLEIGNARTSYETYRGTNYLFGFPVTVYGGVFDALSGILSVTDGYIDSYSGETLPGAWISDRDVYSAGATPSSGAQVVYKLSEPTHYQMSPVAIYSQLGTNVFIVDCGTVNLDYVIGYLIHLKKPSKKDWTYTDIPTASQMDEYIFNISYIKKIISDYRPDTDIPQSMRMLDYRKANQIEQLLIIAEEVVKKIKLSYRGYSGRLVSGVNCLP